MLVVAWITLHLASTAFILILMVQSDRQFDREQSVDSTPADTTGPISEEFLERFARSGGKLTSHHAGQAAVPLRREVSVEGVKINVVRLPVLHEGDLFKFPSHPRVQVEHDLSHISRGLGGCGRWPASSRGSQAGRHCADGRHDGHVRLAPRSLLCAHDALP